MVEQSFEGFAVVQGLLQQRHQLGGHIHTTAAALVGEREDESWMFIASGAGGAVGANARLPDFSQRALNGGPEFFALAEELPAEV